MMTTPATAANASPPIINGSGILSPYHSFVPLVIQTRRYVYVITLFNFILDDFSHFCIIITFIRS